MSRIIIKTRDGDFNILG